MKINNTTDTGVIENVSVVVKVTDEAGTPVAITSNPNDLTAKFFVKISSIKDIANVDGTGVVSPKSTAIINWLLIPAPGSAGTTPAGKKYLVGATLKYRFAGSDTTLEVSPDVITVKPLPLLTLDYFLPRDVYADDPLTGEVEPVVPFTLGVRVRNSGLATAKALKIDSAQPKIIENKQGLLIGFRLTGSYVDDAPVQNTLLIDFGDIASTSNKMGRWVMETTLSGRFTEFTATYTHSDELGGALTSILQATNAHTLVHDVRVDLPGRDAVRDFLALDGDVLRVYESNGPDTVVTDQSASAVFTSVSGDGNTATYSLSFPPTAGFAYVKLTDPFSGSKVPGGVLRSDGKLLAAENVWLSQTRNEQTKQWMYYVNFFDVNTTGSYKAEFQPPAGGPQPPALQFVADRTVTEGQQVSFIVEASGLNGRPVVLSAAPLPTGATFVPDAGGPGGGPNSSRSVFNWTPAVGQAGSYPITFTANDGLLSSNRLATIKVDPAVGPVGPGAPAIASPLSGAQVATLRPSLAAQASTAAQDTTTQLQFELYADEAMLQPVASTQLAKAADNPPGTPQPTVWALPADLFDNTPYWWRVRASDGTRFSLWVNGRFFVNLANDPPERFNLLLPVPEGEVADLQPTLSWSNALDKDGDVVSYGVRVYADAALSQQVASVDGVAADASGSTGWKVATPLTLRKQYWWKVIATDAPGAQTVSTSRSFYVGVGNVAPTAPSVVSPVSGATVPSLAVDLVVNSATDADGDLVTLVFELDVVPTFDSGAKRSSGQLIQTGSPTMTWRVTGLTENQRYYWRVKAQDGRAESAWVQASFLASAVNDLPSPPTVRNPGDGAWVSSLVPVLEVNPSTDPEGSVLSYEFQVATDPTFASVLQSGLSNAPSWMVPQPLTDKTTYRWRGRAIDAEGARSEWSLPAVMYVSTATYQDPTIQVTEPAVPLAPTLRDGRKFARIAWAGTDLNIEPTVALYYATSKTAFAGTLIVDGLRQPAGTQPGSYDWDVTALPVGTYYVYAVIYDSRGAGQAWAPGAVVIVGASQTGSVVVTAAPNLQTTEDGGQATFKVRLGSAPTADVVLPVASSRPGEGLPDLQSLTFTTQNWNVDRQVTLTGQADCIPERIVTYQVTVGKAVSLDAQYFGLSAVPLDVSNQDGNTYNITSTNNRSVRICALAVKSATKIGLAAWEYVLDAGFGNSGAAVAGGTATLVGVPGLLTVVDGSLSFGPLQKGEYGRSADTITLRSKIELPVSFFQNGLGLKWSLTAN